MDIQALLAQLDGGGGNVNMPRPMMLNPNAAMGALPQMPHPMQPGPQAPNQSAMMAAQALSPPQQQQQQDPLGGMGSLLSMTAMGNKMNGGGGLGPLGDLVGLNKQKLVDAEIPAYGGLPSMMTKIDPNMPDLGGQSAGIHGLFHRLAGLWGGV